MTTTQVAIRHRVYLYDDSGRLTVPGVLVRRDRSSPDLAVFAPWPSSAGRTSRIAVGIHPHRAARDAWPGVTGVDVFDIVGAGSSRDLGVVELARRLTFSPGLPEQRVSRAQLVDAIDRQPGDVGAVLARLGDDVFTGLAGSAAPSPGTPAAAPAGQLAAPVRFTAREGPPAEMAAFLCEIFRWD